MPGTVVRGTSPRNQRGVEGDLGIVKDREVWGGVGWGRVIPGAPYRTLNVASTARFLLYVCFSTPGWLPWRRLGPSLGSTGVGGFVPVIPT